MEKQGVKNIAIFASGRGSNFSAIARAVKKGKLPVNICLLISDKPKAAVVGKARRLGIKVALVGERDRNIETDIIQHLQENKIDLIALAGFMRVLSPGLVKRYAGRIMNIHPSLLPSFKGAHGIQDAFDYGVKVTGVTVHFVDEKMDHGPIILQSALTIKENESIESLERRTHQLEHKLYPEAIRLFVEGKLKVEGRKVKIL